MTCRRRQTLKSTSNYGNIYQIMRKGFENHFFNTLLF